MMKPPIDPSQPKRVMHYLMHLGLTINGARHGQDSDGKDIIRDFHCLLLDGKRH